MNFQLDEIISYAKKLLFASFMERMKNYYLFFLKLRYAEVAPDCVSLQET